MQKKRKCERCGNWFDPFEVNNGQKGYSHLCRPCVRNKKRIREVI